MKTKCKKCGKEQQNISSTGECDECRRKRQDDDDSFLTQSMNIALGDILNTGMPGGTDFDVTTPL